MNQFEEKVIISTQKKLSALDNQYEEDEITNVIYFKKIKKILKNLS